MRSNDLKLGWPHNVVQFTTLQEMMAGWLGVEPGSYTHFSDSLHVYIRDLDQLVEPVVLEAEANTDRWMMGYSETMEVIEDLGRRMDAIRGSARDEVIIRRVGVHEYPSVSATNALAIIAADAARRAKAPTLADDLASRCTNPLLRQLWHRWSERRQSGSEEANADET